MSILDEVVGPYLKKYDTFHEVINSEQFLALANAIRCCKDSKKNLFICGNGGSGANAIHIANDLIYGTTKSYGSGIKCHALTENSSIITCLANDESYSDIFSFQLGVLAEKEDILLVLSGSGNSANIINAISAAKSIGMQTFGILGFSGGKAKAMIDYAIHLPVNDMQVSEDFQMTCLHIISQWIFQSESSLS